MPRIFTGSMPKEPSPRLFQAPPGRAAGSRARRTLALGWLALALTGCRTPTGEHLGAQIVAAPELARRFPSMAFRLPVQDQGVVMRHGYGPDHCDYLGARDVWVWKHRGKYYMHYDGAGPKGWLVCLATSKDGLHWQPRGAVLDLGPAGKEDSATASYGITYHEKGRWHMFYLGSPRVSGAPDLVPIGPYATLKAEADRPEGPWRKRYDLPVFKIWTNPPYANTGPGQVLKDGDEYLMFFSGLDIARSKDLNNNWQVSDPHKPVLPQEGCENTSLYFEPENRTWFLFSNHIGAGYTDSIWVYWSKDLRSWDPANKALVLDGYSCSWSKTIVGLPSVVKIGNRLALYYDGNPDPKDQWHLKRDVGLAWVELPIRLPDKK